MTRPSLRKTPLIVLGFVGIGLLLRLYELELMEFKGDEQEAINLGIRLLNERPWSSDHPWPTHGMLSSHHLANAPLFNWIMALAWVLGRSPIGATALVALVNGISLFPLWLWARRRFREQRALLVLAIAAVSPFTVLFSRKLWAQDLLLPGLLCVLWAIEWARDGRLWRAAALVATATLLVGQLHQSGLIALGVLPIAVVLQLALDRREARSSFRLVRPSSLETMVLVTIIGLNMLLWLPYVSYLMTVPFEIFVNRPKVSDYHPTLLYRALSQVAPLSLLDFFEPDSADFLANPLRRFVYQVAIVVGGVLAGYGLWRWLRSPLRLPVVGIWWSVVIAVFTVAQIPTYPFYVLILSPLPVVLAAGGFDPEVSRSWTARSFLVLRWAYVATLLTLTVLTAQWLRPRGGSGGDYGIIYAVREAQGHSIVRQLTSTPRMQQPGWGELQPHERIAMDCSRVPAEVRWIVQWIDPGQDSIPDTLQICDAWVRTERGWVYRWTIRNQSP